MQKGENEVEETLDFDDKRTARDRQIWMTNILHVTIGKKDLAKGKQLRIAGGLIGSPAIP